MKTLWHAIKREGLRLLREDDGFINLIAAAIPLIGGLFGGKAAKSAGQNAAGGATMQQLMPIMMDLIKQQQAQSGQNYGMQMQRYGVNLPLEDAIRNMTMRMMPRQVQMPMGTPISRQPVPPMAPIKPVAQAAPSRLGSRAPRFQTEE